MTKQKMIEDIRDYIREQGFVSAMQIISRFAFRTEPDGVQVIDVLFDVSECNDIKVVEYTNSSVVGFGRVKDLFYYNPFYI